MSSCARKNFFQADAQVPGKNTAAASDSVWAEAGRHYNRHGRFFNWFIGPHHRAVWAAPVHVPVFDLASADAAGRLSLSNPHAVWRPDPGLGASRRTDRTAMLDLVLLTAGLAFFGLAAGYTALCARL